MVSTLSQPHSDSSSLDLLSDRVAKGSRLLVWVHGAARLGVVLSAVMAGVVLIGRSLLGVDLLVWPSWSLAGKEWLGAAAYFLVAWLAAGAYAWRKSGQGAMTRSDAALYLDLHSDASGQVVTAQEVTDESAAAWRRDAVELAEAAEDVPRAHWPVLLRALAASAALFIAAAFVPIRVGSVLTNDGIAAVFEERLEEIEELLEVLDEEVALEEEDKSDLEESLERLEESIQNDPDLEATYEALDRLEAQLETRAEEALAQAMEALESLAEAQRLSGDAMAQPESPTENATAEASSGIEPSELLELPLSKLAEFAAGELSEFAVGDLSPSELAELAAAMELAMGAPLSALEQAGLLKPGAVKGSLAKFKPAGDLPELTEEQLAMLGLCPDCGEEPCDECAATGGT